DGLSTVTDSTATWGDLAPGVETAGDAMVFVPSSASAKVQLRVSDQYGELWTQMIDLALPATPVDLLGNGAASSIKLTWAKVTAGDLLGYNVYRGSVLAGPYTKINPVPTERTAY